MTVDTQGFTLTGLSIVNTRRPHVDARRHGDRASNITNNAIQGGANPAGAGGYGGNDYSQQEIHLSLRFAW